MKSIYFFPLLLLVAAGAGTAGYWVQHRESTTQLTLSAHRPDFQLLDLEGKIRKNAEWDGKIVIVNFWATWCPPCIAEIPIFIELQQQYEKQGIQFIGIAIDQLESVQNFAKKQQINYPILIGNNNDEAISISRNFGNDLGALPFTAIINQRGEVVLRHRGEIERQEIEKVILPLFKSPI
ncbi:MAG: hypothetical protein BWK79_05225 [Beggiatoa sp. IS2]|nr:MAG: hypothetical protein BWK79_05225 [Beggiatoa sp. IS2]